MMKKIRSLKYQLLLNLAIPLIMFVTLDTVLSYFVTLHYVNETYDRWLLDSAESLIQEIQVKNAHTTVELPPAALKMFKWDELDKVSFKIIYENQQLLAGDARVPAPDFFVNDWSKPVFYETLMNNEPVRLIAMRIQYQTMSEPVFVYVAETKYKRGKMMRDILLSDLIPQLLLLSVASFYLLRGIRTGLQPLHELAKAIAERSPRDLSPIADRHIFLEVQTLTNTINDLLHQLDNAIATQNRFIANAAHQLRTPLAGLKLQAERALREPDVTALKPALVQIQQCADRLSHLTTQLLVLAKSEPIKGGHELKAVNLSHIVREVCIDWVPKALQRKMELSFLGTKTDLFIFGDETLLRELLSNLLDNAICYGYDKGHITVMLQEQPVPRLKVEDDGPGIPAEEQSRVFERFYRTANSSGNGCGLGLAIVKEIADLHEATVTINSSLKQGVCIDVVFPAWYH